MAKNKTDKNDNKIEIQDSGDSGAPVEDPLENENQPVAAGTDSDQDEVTIDDPMVALQKERDELEGKYLRVSADYQNYVRRSQQNIISATEQQMMEIARTLLTVMDHFDHALDVDPEKRSTEGLLEGVQIVRDELLKNLERFGVKRVEVGIGDEFDPNLHEAMMRQSVEDLQPNQVAAQLQPGYMLGDKTLRPAKVSVAE